MINKTQSRPLPKEIKLSEFMKLPTKEEQREIINELCKKEHNNKNLDKLVIEKKMEPYRMKIEDNIGFYMYGTSYKEPRDKVKVPARLQATENKVWIPTFSFRMEKVNIIE